MNIYEYMERMHKEGIFKLKKKGRKEVEDRLFMLIDHCIQYKTSTKMSHPVVGLHGEDKYNDCYNELYFYVLALVDARIIDDDMFWFILKSVK